MRYKLLGKTGLRVSEICLGAMTFGEDWGWGASKEVSRKMVKAFLDAGGNFIDTANHYTQGTSEKYLGDFIKRNREEVVLATKFTLNQRPGDPNAGGNHRKCMVEALNASLKRLGTDYVDLYWLHAWDFMSPVEEVMRALDDLVRSGRVLYVGVSDAPAWIVSQANTLAELRGWSAFAGLQIQYSLIERTAERDLLPMAEALDITVTPWSPLGMGVLTGKYSGKRGQARPKGARFTDREEWAADYLTARNLRIAAEVDKVAKQVGGTSSQVAINWIRQQKRSVLVPIIGTRNLKQLQDNLGCLEFELNASQMKRLDKVSSVELGFPHDFLSAPNIQEIVYGNTLELTDNHRRHGGILEGDSGMKAIRFEKAGPVEVLKYMDLPRPEPGPGQVLIKTAAISVNFVDLLIRQGTYPALELPHIPGGECSGTIESVGPGVAGLAPGDRVVLFGEHLHHLCYAEQVVADASVVTALPAGVDLDEAAVLPVVYLTAYHMLHTMAHVQRGQTVLLHAAAGGVGMAAAQLAKLGKARVIGLTSSPQKVKFAAEQGCDHVINYKTEDVAARVGEITGGEGVQVILNSVAGPTLGRDFEMLAPLGQIIWYGMAAGPPQDDLKQKLAAGFGTSLGLRTFAIYSVHALGPEVMNKSLTAMLQLLADKKITPRIHARVPLAEAARAHQMLESGTVTGKVILKP